MTKKVNYSLNELDLKPLPADNGLEKMVLGLFLDVPSLVEPLRKYISIEGIFYGENNSRIWDAIKKVVDFKIVANQENVKGFFVRKGDLEMANYVMYLSTCSGNIADIQRYCLKLFEIAVLRNIIRIGYDINQKGYARNDALDLLITASNGIGKLYEHIAGMKTKTLQDGIDELGAELIEISNSPDGMLGIKGTLPALNNITKGYRKGNMIIIGASSGEGKSTFMLQEASCMVLLDIPVGIISLEMTQSELLLKICCEKLNIDISDALSGKLSSTDLSRISDFLGQMKKMPLFISDTPAMKIGEIKATARMWKSRHKIQALFIDHLHLANSDFQHLNAEQKYTDIANQIKEVAKELGIPVITLAQLARKDNITEKRMHVMTDLKYAGGIEQAADLVIMIFRPEEHGIEETSDGESTKGKAIIKVAKMRLLPKGSVKCEFDGLRFKDVNNSNWRNFYSEDTPF